MAKSPPVPVAATRFPIPPSPRFPTKSPKKTSWTSLRPSEAPSFPIRPMLAPSDLPVGAINPPQNFTGGGFVFPPIPVELPNAYGPYPNGENVDGHCKPKHHHHKGGESPEPSTMLLLGSGMALILWRCRKFARPATA